MEEIITHRPQRLTQEIILRRLRLKARWFSAPFRTLPSFLILGVPKSGTTSLFHYLASHPQVLPPVQKEIYYFDRAGDRHLNWYRRFFPLQAEVRRQMAKLGRIVVTGEASPYYYLRSTTAERIRTQLPDAKLILIVRDPVLRAWSHYRHNVRRGVEPLSFTEALEAERNPNHPLHRRGTRFKYVRNGMYARHLKNWMTELTSGRMCLTVSAFLRRDTLKELNRINEFLGIDTVDSLDLGEMNVGDDEMRLQPADREYLAQRFAKPNERLFRMLGTRFEHWIRP